MGTGVVSKPEFPMYGFWPKLPPGKEFGSVCCGEITQQQRYPARLTRGRLSAGVPASLLPGGWAKVAA